MTPLEPRASGSAGYRRKIIVAETLQTQKQERFRGFFLRARYLYLAKTALETRIWAIWGRPIECRRKESAGCTARGEAVAAPTPFSAQTGSECGGHSRHHAGGLSAAAARTEPRDHPQP